MKIVFWPAIIEESLVASVSGDVLTINGKEFDFSPMGEGMQLPGDAANSFWIVNEAITRIDGVVTVTVKLPVHWDTPESVRSPKVPMYTVVTDGPVGLPDTSPPLVVGPLVDVGEDLVWDDGKEAEINGL